MTEFVRLGLDYSELRFEKAPPTLEFSELLPERHNSLRRPPSPAKREKVGAATSGRILRSVRRRTEYLRDSMLAISQMRAARGGAMNDSSAANSANISPDGVFFGDISSEAFRQGEEIDGWTDASRSIGFAVRRLAPPKGGRLIARGVVRALPGVTLISAASTPFHVFWDKTLNDDVFLCFNDGCGMSNLFDHGAEVAIEGAGALIVNPETAPTTVYRGETASCLRIARSALRAIPEDLLFKRQALQSGRAFGLLTTYLGVLKDPEAMATARQREMAVAHIHDLAVLAIGARGDAREAAIARGGGAARLYALKKDVERFLFRHDLGAEFLALHNAITPRHVHRLFEAEGVSLSQYVLERRLLEGYRLLAERESKGRSVADIAFSLGFGDLSYFNRTFARRFRAQPREVRRLFQTF